MIFNKGSYISKFATIAVNCPARASVTISCGRWSYTKTATGGSASFVVPISGVWTISVTYSGVTQTDTVSVTTYGATYTKSLDLLKYLFKAGSGAIVPWTTYGDASVSTNNIAAKGKGKDPVTQSGAYTTSNVDLTNYSKLHITMTSSPTAAGGAGGVNGADNKYWKSSLIQGTNTIDISDLTGSYQIRVTSIATYNMTITNVWLEP